MNGKIEKMLIPSICLKCKYYKTLSPDKCSKYCEKCKKVKEKVNKSQEIIEELKYCRSCNCMTHTKKGYIYLCGKCGKDKRRKQNER